tara:strand:+ start:151 stop:531 length:381 start_codon:yes stop_codon:yes gene_type:complete
MELCLDNVNLFGRLAAIIGWYHDENTLPVLVGNDQLEEGEPPMTQEEIESLQESCDEDVRYAQDNVAQMIGCIPAIISNGPQHLVDTIDKDLIFDLYDAVGSFDQRDAELELVYRRLATAWGKANS